MHEDENEVQRTLRALATLSVNRCSQPWAMGDPSPRKPSRVIARLSCCLQPEPWLLPLEAVRRTFHSCLMKLWRGEGDVGGSRRR